MAAVVSLIALCVLAFNQVDTWRNSEALYRRALSVTERNFVAHKGLAGELLRDERFEEAEHHFARSAELAPGWVYPSIDSMSVMLGRVERGEMVCTPPPGMLKAMRSLPALALASRRACLSEPGPLSAVLVTVNVAALAA